MTNELNCMDVQESDSCEGTIEYHSLAPGRVGAWPRCEKHWEECQRRHRQMKGNA